MIKTTNMSLKTISIPESSIVNMLMNLPKSSLINIFWQVLATFDTSPLSKQEKEDIKIAKKEFKKGETIKWQDIKQNI